MVMALWRDVLGASLRRLRLRQGRTLRDVSASAAVSLGYLSEIERGRKEPSSEILAAICRALGLELADLLDEVQFDLAAARPAVPVRLQTTSIHMMESAPVRSASLGPQANASVGSSQAYALVA